MGLEDVGNQVGSFVGSGVMGLTVGDLLIGEYAGIKLSACLLGHWWAWKISVIESADLLVAE